MMEYSYSTGESLLEERKMEEAFVWEPEMVLFNENVDVSTFHLDSAPVNFGSILSASAPDNGLQVHTNDWMSSGVDFLDHIVNNDFCVPFLQQSNGQEKSTSLFLSSPFNGEKSNLPASPAVSYDSGVGSPYSDTSSVSLESLSPTNVNVFLNSEPLPPPLENLKSFDFPLHNANEELPVNYVKDESIEQLEICLVPETFHTEVAHHSTEVSHQSPKQNLSYLTADDIAAFIDASEHGEFQPGNSSPDSSASSIRSTPSPDSLKAESPRSRSGRKRKVTSLEDKKQRKRDQNKNAATRYRERKRQEAEERELEFGILNTRNKELKDKISQITKEMDYLKELMIEVYTLKGLIS